MNGNITKTKQTQIFDEWIKAHKSLLFKVLRAYAFNPNDRDDLFQEISIQLWNSVPKFRGDSAVTTWVYRVALFSAISWTRREKKHNVDKQSLDGVAHTLTETPQSGDGRLDWLYNQIAQLNEIDRSLTLLMLDGYSYKEMSGILGISESYVGVKINRIKKHLMDKSKEV